MKDTRNDNLNVFVGACVEPPSVCLVTAFCPRGSLEDVLANDDIQLDFVFKMSFAMDMVNVRLSSHVILIAVNVEHVLQHCRRRMKGRVCCLQNMSNETGAKETAMQNAKHVKWKRLIEKNSRSQQSCQFIRKNNASDVDNSAQPHETRHSYCSDVFTETKNHFFPGLAIPAQI